MTSDGDGNVPSNKNCQHQTFKLPQSTYDIIYYRDDKDAIKLGSSLMWCGVVWCIMVWCVVCNDFYVLTGAVVGVGGVTTGSGAVSYKYVPSPPLAPVVSGSLK